jgi:ribosomal protein L11 methyltransferase
VWAIDYDPQALTATIDNAERNQLDLSKLHCGKNADLPDDYQADIVVANILANPLVVLAPTLAQHVKPNGDIILSGILHQQADTVSEAYAPFFSMEDPFQQEDWIRLTGHK